MKKLFLVSAIALVSVASVNAQGAQFGITAGLNLSNVYGDDVESADMKAGFQAGVVVDLALSENFSIVPELLFSQRGDKVDGDIGGYDVTVKETLNYLQLPINAMYKVPVGNDSKFLLFAGPYFGYGLSISETAEADGDSVTSDDVKFGSSDDEVNPLDVGVNFGLGFQISGFFIKAQYNLGLTSLSNGSADVKNNNIGISVGYLF